ncbi:MAG: hypothetical protein KJT03_05070 [Verrucomicrobiae bacterium]|nr:hypothetical protein [Verrucomicrobiae bacterium]
MNPHDTYKSVAREQSRAAGQRLLQTYRLAIEANAMEDKETVVHCLDLLKRTLDFNSDPGLCHTLNLIYQDCETALKEGRHDVVGEILETVKGLWQARIKLEEIAKNRR